MGGLTIEGESRPEHDSVLPSDTVRFAHESERQFARLLDFYQIEWDYEPRSFDIEWDRNGNPTQRFTPDFYLPAFDLFIEITTLSQRLVTKKNRKVRRLRELYPEVKCKIFYQKDYQNLVLKYGLGGHAGAPEPHESPGAAGPLPRRRSRKG
ncbi:MAG: hypothetical protein ACRDIF_00670 [Actinomycetota bacterium]